VVDGHRYRESLSQKNQIGSSSGPNRNSAALFRSERADRANGCTDSPNGAHRDANILPRLV
jgi:hypothetical protein